MIQRWVAVTFWWGAVEYLAARLMRAVEFDHERGLYPDQSVENYSLDEARREVLAHCVFGVDMNPLAVELAKVSLWLMTISKDKPLSFLDHHLKCGNSLIGALLEEIPWFPGARPEGVTTRIDKTTSLLEKLRTKLIELEAVSDDAIERVRKKEELFRSLLRSPEYERVRLLADAHVGLRFTKPSSESKSEYTGLVDLVYSEGGMADVPETMEWANEATKEAGNRQTFHWELEFPEVFLKEDGDDSRGGFDVVIGNPPYVSYGLGRVGKLDSFIDPYLRSAYPHSAEYKISLYALFMELSTRLTRKDGFQGLILPDSFLVGRYFSKIRGLILSQRLLRLVHFDKDFWESGDVGFPVIWLGQRTDPATTFVASFVGSLEGLVSGEITNRELALSQPLANRRKRIRLIRNNEIASLLTQIEASDSIISDWASLHHGIRSKVGRENIITKSPPDGNHRWKKGLVESNQVTRYHLDYHGDYLLVEPSLLFSGGWDPSDIEVPKLLIRRTGDSIITCVDTGGHYHTNALIYANIRGSEPVALRILCGILNSKLFTYYYREVTSKEGRTFPQVEIDSLEELSIPRLVSSFPDWRAGELSFEDYVEAGNFREACTLIRNAKGRIEEMERYLGHLVSEIELLKNKVAVEDSKFTEWLKVASGSDIEAWEGKRGFEELFSSSLDSLVEIFRRNEDKSLLKPSKSADDLQTLRQNFEASVGSARPLILKATVVDSLIDLTVYGLYGLSLEQIAQIEGSAIENVREKYLISE